MVFDLIRRDFKFYRFYMISIGIVVYVFKRWFLEFKVSDLEKLNFIDIVSFFYFEDSDFIW